MWLEIRRSRRGKSPAFLTFFFPVLCQMYTRSVIDPIPAPEGDAASKAADKQKKKGGRMTDEEIMEKLSM